MSKIHYRLGLFFGKWYRSLYYRFSHCWLWGAVWFARDSSKIFKPGTITKKDFDKWDKAYTGSILEELRRDKELEKKIKYDFENKFLFGSGNKDRKL